MVDVAGVSVTDASQSLTDFSFLCGAAAGIGSVDNRTDFIAV